MSITTLDISNLEKNVSKYYVKSIMNKLNMGFIVSMVEKPMKHDKMRKKIVIRTELNPQCPIQDMNYGDSLNVVHRMGEPFWKILKMS